MSLQSSWVDRIFDKLTVTYGHHFLSRWSGLDLKVVKADWAHELRGFAQAGEAIAYALSHLPADQPPTVLQFRKLCNSMPPPTFQALAPPDVKPDPQRVAALIAMTARPKSDAISPAAQCAAGLRRRIADGQRLTENQRWVLDCCERAGVTEREVLASFNPINAKVLPPGMRAGSCNDAAEHGPDRRQDAA